ncbi:MAG: hypothetical protein DRI57_22895 [Deltaproteobacteria bacterium]|nr:MAG: hypothetical protein DRI57_22895 [Deltaproteobacteria bacterium]
MFMGIDIGQGYDDLFLNMKRLVIIFAILTFFATGCTSFKQRPDEPSSRKTSPEAEALFNKLQKQNSQLQSFKGTGRIRMQNENGIQRARIIWAGYKNEKFRLEIMGPSGQPTLSFTYDGSRIYLISHTESRFYSKRSSNASLEKMISLPIGVNEALDLLAGRIPIGIYRSPILLGKEQEDEQVLVLKRTGRNRGYDNITVATAADVIRQIESFANDGSLNYRAKIISMQEISGFRVPKELQFSGEGQVGLQIVVERFWPNAPVSESLFVLTAPE